MYAKEDTLVMSSNLGFEDTDTFLMEERLFTPPEETVRNANITAYMKSKGFDNYEDFYKWSLANPYEFWDDMAKELHWYEPWQTTFEWTDKPFFKWFSGAKFNAAYNCLDRYMDTPVRHKVAYYWEADDGSTRSITYEELYKMTNQMTKVLQNLGVKKGDRVAVYLPMIPELVVTMLACARLGAAHMVVFGGFAASSLRDRIIDCEAKVLVTADGGYRGGKVIELKKIADEAVAETPNIQKLIVVRRTGKEVPMAQGRDMYLDDLLKEVPEDTVVPCEPVDSEDMLYILYTSGSTGKPKGVVHVQGGYSVGVYATTKFVFDIKPSDIFWCTADIGWVTGHSYIVYGPLMNASTGVLFESIPTYPAPDRFWEVVEKYKVNTIYTAPTAIRSLMRFGEEMPAKQNLSSLRLLGTAGRPIT